MTNRTLPERKEQFVRSVLSYLSHLPLPNPDHYPNALLRLSQDFRTLQKAMATVVTQLSIFVGCPFDFEILSVVAAEQEKVLKQAGRPVYLRLRSEIGESDLIRVSKRGHEENETAEQTCEQLRDLLARYNEAIRVFPDLLPDQLDWTDLIGG